VCFPRLYAPLHSLDEQPWKNSVIVQGIPAARYRSLIQGPDGALYAVVDVPPALWRLAPDGTVFDGSARSQGGVPGDAQPPSSPTNDASGAEAPGSASAAGDSRGVSEATPSRAIATVCQIAVVLVATCVSMLFSC
jgi:hypothetical protein